VSVKDEVKDISRWTWFSHLSSWFSYCSYSEFFYVNCIIFYRPGCRASHQTNSVKLLM